MKILNYFTKPFLLTYYLLLITYYFPSASFAQEENLQLEDFDYWANLCSSLSEVEEYEEAIKACNTAITINAKDSIVWTDRGDIYLTLKNYPETVASYSQVLKLDPNNSLIWARQCLALSELGRQEEAIDACETALKKDQNWEDESPAIALTYLGIARRRTGEREDALFSYDQATTINENYALAWANRCEVLAELGDNYRALEACDRALSIEPNPDLQSQAVAWANKGRVLAKLQRRDEALFAYDQALAIDSENARNWTEHGEILFTLARYEEAQASHDWALGINEKYSLALANKCAVLNRLRMYEEALEACDLALQEGDGQWNEFGPALGWNQRAYALIGSGSFQEAVTSSNRAVALDDNYAEAWSNRAAALWRLGRFDQARLRPKKQPKAMATTLQAGIT